MIVLDCEQGSPEWHAARIGIPTASQFHRILTPKTMKLGSGAESYMQELLAEWLIGIPGGPEARGFMERGKELEAWAVAYYELQRELATERVGLCLRDDRQVAASPDRLVGEVGGMEIKCPSAATQVAALLGNADDHKAQVQGALYITGRQWWDLVSYHPEIPTALVRVHRDEAYIAALHAALNEFVNRLDANKERLIAMGCEPATCLSPEFACG